MDLGLMSDRRRYIDRIDRWWSARKAPTECVQGSACAAHGGTLAKSAHARAQRGREALSVGARSRMFRAGGRQPRTLIAAREDTCTPLPTQVTGQRTLHTT